MPPNKKGLWALFICEIKDTLQHQVSESREGKGQKADLVYEGLQDEGQGPQNLQGANVPQTLTIEEGAQGRAHDEVEEDLEVL